MQGQSRLMISILFGALFFASIPVMAELINVLESPLS